MNWTGGRLSRHSGKGTNNKQKEHYLRAQQRIRAEKKGKSPTRWTILNHVVEEGSTSRWDRTLQLQVNERFQTGHGRESDKPWRPYYRPPSTECHMDTKPHLGKGSYDAILLPSRGAKRQRVGSPTIEANTAADRRRRLLNKDNWTGIVDIASPRTKFMTPKNDIDIGRRRKIKDGHKAVFGPRQMHIESPFMRRNRAYPSTAQNDLLPHIDRTEVKISIGDRIIRPGLSSGTNISRDNGHSSLDLSRKQYPESFSSEVMLLDQDASTPQRTYTHANRRTYLSSGLPGSTAKAVLGRFTNDPHPNYRFCNDSDIGFLAPSAVPNSSRHASTSASTPSRSILQPIPWSSKVSSLLRSSSSEIAETTAGQYGESKPYVPVSQTSDHETWKTWVENFHVDSDGCSVNLEPSDNLKNVVVGNNSNNAFHTETNSIMRTKGVSLVYAKMEAGALSSIPTSSEKMFHGRSRLYSNQPFEKPNEDENYTYLHRSNHVSGKTTAKQSHASIPFVYPNAKQSQTERLGQALVGNSDELWLKFVFGSEGEENYVESADTKFHNSQNTGQDYICGRVEPLTKKPDGSWSGNEVIATAERDMLYDYSSFTPGPYSGDYGDSSEKDMGAQRGNRETFC